MKFKTIFDRIFLSHTRLQIYPVLLCFFEGVTFSERVTDLFCQFPAKMLQTPEKLKLSVHASF